MMKIAILGPVYPFKGGIAHHTGILHAKLAAGGHTVKQFSFRKQFPSFLFPGKSQFDKSHTRMDISAERTFIPWNPLTWFAAAKSIKNFAPDLLIPIWWTPFTGPGYWGVLSALAGKFPVLFILHNVIPHEKMPGIRFFTKAALKFGGGYIVQSKKVENEFLNFLPDCADKWRRLIPHPTYNFQDYSFPSQEDARKRLGIAEKKVLLFFGLVRKYKGLMNLIRAFPEAEKSLGDLRLLIAGEFYDDIEPYRKAIAESGVEAKITIRNEFIPAEEVGTYFSAADVVVLPYVSASQSGIVQTAYGFNKPVISTRVGGLPEIIDDSRTGLLCEPENPAELTAKIIEFYELSKNIDWQSNVEAVKPKFSWDNMIAAVETYKSDCSIIKS